MLGVHKAFKRNKNSGLRFASLHILTHYFVRLMRLHVFLESDLEIAKLIDTGFSTADAEYPEIFQVDGDVILKFRDWREEKVEIFFADPIAMKWQMAESSLNGERCDSCYEIEQSNWLKLHIDQDEVSESEGYKHFKFNFNEIGQFEVLALNYQLKT
ncbi:hypothetical protein AB4487_23580, partial [Vibrio splendidus]